LLNFIIAPTILAPLVSIVILNWNGQKYLEQFLPSVLSSTYSNFRIVVADNASTDDSIPFLRSYYPVIRVIELKGNYGFARGYNEALKDVDGDYYVLLNSDVEVEPSWIEPVVELMENDNTIAACQPKLLQYHNRSFFEYSGASGGWLDRLGYPFARGRIFDVCEQDNGQYDTVEPIFWASGAAMFVRAKLFHEAGGLDDYFFAHQEEIDFCWKLQRMGYTVYSCPQSVVYHVGGGTLPKGNSRKVFLNFRNNLVMMAKNMPAGEAIWKIAYRFLLDTVSAVKSLLAGEGRYFTAVFRAHGAFLAWLFSSSKKVGNPNGYHHFESPAVDGVPDLFKQKALPERRTVPRKKVRLQGYLKKSVVWAHFIEGKKTFAEIVNTKS
jgi:GT2 family glycosyltransferase